MPSDTALSAGTQTLSVTLKSAGSRIITASDVSNGAIVANVSPGIPVNAGPFTKLQLLLPGETAAWLWLRPVENSFSSDGRGRP